MKAPDSSTGLCQKLFLSLKNSAHLLFNLLWPKLFIEYLF